ncbi:MAG: hypothetical protein U0800_13725 [Isosphaeraceae bacterium]
MLDEKPPTLISLAKQEEEVFVPGRSEPIRLSRRSFALRLLQAVRDEAPDRPALSPPAAEEADAGG